VVTLDASGRDKLNSCLMSISSSGPAILTEERADPDLLLLKTGARAISRACARRRAVSNPSCRPSSIAMGSSRTVSAMYAA